MILDENLSRLRPFEGLCLTADDLISEQTYHRRSLARALHFLHGHGVVQGLQVELVQSRKRYTGTIKGGFGLTREGVGLRLAVDQVVPMEVPRQDGEYVLWLRHLEKADPASKVPVFDLPEEREARLVESVAPSLLPADQDVADGVALARIAVRLGRMAVLDVPVPRAGFRPRMAESRLKPPLCEFMRLNRRVLGSLVRTGTLKEMSVGLVGFSGALAAGEFSMLEEGTPDRVLYRGAGLLIGYAHDFYSPLPPTTERVAQLTEFVRVVNADVPGPDQSDDTWLRWFGAFERLNQPLMRVSEELEQTIEATR